MRRVRDEIAASTLNVHLVGDVADDREPLIGAVRDDLNVQPARLMARRGNRDAVAGRLFEIGHEIGIAKQVVEAVADIRGVAQAEQARGRRIEPHDFVVGIQDDAAVGERARALANLPQQPMIFLLAVAGLRTQLFDAREHLGPEPARLE